MSQAPPLLIVQMGSPSGVLRHQLGEQSDWFRAALQDQTQNIIVVRPDLQEDLPDESDFSAAVITGSWSMVTDHDDWSDRTGAWAKGLIESGKPLLGVCYGHQLMADVMGGVVDYHPDGRELGTLPITLNARGQADPFFGQLPRVFNAHLTHMQSVLTPPPGAQALGSSAHDAYQILRYGPNALSVQFHPEFTVQILQAIVDARETVLGEEGIDVSELRSGIKEAPFARQILLMFARLYEDGRSLVSS